MKNSMAQGMGRFEAPDRTPFAVGGSARCRAGALEATCEIEYQDARQLPSPVDMPALDGYAAEGQPTLEFAVDLFMNPRGIPEMPQGASGHRLVGRHPRVFIVPVIGIGQIQLKVLRGFVEYALAIDHDPKGARAGLYPVTAFETLYSVFELFPPTPTGNAFLDPQSRTKRHLDFEPPLLKYDSFL